MKKLMTVLCMLMLGIFLSACGGDKEPAPAPAPAPADPAPAAEGGAIIETPLWTLAYDPEVWVYDEEDLTSDEDWSNVILIIPGAEEDSYLVNTEIRVSLDEPYSFRDKLVSYGFDEYEYAVNNAYAFTPIGGVDCLMQEGNYWGEPCLRYFNRVEGAGADVFIEIIGEYDDERVAALLNGLTFTLTDVGNEDGPWYWEGEPFSQGAHSVMVGTYAINSEWIPFTDFIMTKETFDHAIAVAGDKAYVLNPDGLKQYAFDGTSLVYESDIALNGEYDNLQVAEDGTLWLSSFMEPLIAWKDGAQTASYEGPDYVAMHPSGTWGISWFSDPEVEKITLSGGALTTSTMTFPEVDMISHLMVDENYIYVCGPAVSDDGHRVFVYSPDGVLQKTLQDSDGGGLGSISAVVETANGFVGLDGNMREIILWNKDGVHVGAMEDGDLFGTSYPWLCDAELLDDGSILVILTEDRADQSAMELAAFKISGF